MQLPGFRKGHVPTSVIKKKYGPSILAEEIDKILNKSIYDYITENKLNILGNPLPIEDEKIKRDAKKLEMKCNKAVKMMKEIASDFKKIYGVSTSNAVLYNNLKDFEELSSKADGKYGGWFQFANGNPDYEK